MTGDQILRSAVAEAAGFDVEALGEAAFARAVEGRMARRGFASRAEYAAALRGSAAEMQDLVEELVVPETWFFRDRGPFEFLRDWAAKSRHGFLRALSAPCSTGEEAYSIGIALLEAGLAPESFSIDAVDISRQALDAARRAVYRRSSFREDWSRYRHYFTTEEQGIALRKEVAQLVRFHRDNLVQPSFLEGQGPYQVVFCRNLLIYLDAAGRRAALANLARLLAPDGIVLVGASELPVFVRNGYAAVAHPYSFACRKAAPAEAQPPPLRMCAPPVESADQAAAEAAPPGEGPLDAAWRLADHGALDQASRICDRLLAQEPGRPEHYYLKGLLSEALDQLDDAESFFRKTLYLNPDYYPALLHMSALCERRGEPSRGGLFRARAQRIAARGVEFDEPRS